MLDLDPEYLRIIKNIIEKYLPGMKVWAYGSRVNGQSHKGSDLDLVVIYPEGPSDQENLYKIREAFSESSLPILIDIHNWAIIPESFRQEIKKNYVEIL
jgi:predicted nucleotidyltransferase